MSQQIANALAAHLNAGIDYNEDWYWGALGAVDGALDAFDEKRTGELDRSDSSTIFVIGGYLVQYDERDQSWDVSRDEI